jgi:hypothetical protein
MSESDNSNNFGTVNPLKDICYSPGACTIHDVLSTVALVMLGIATMEINLSGAERLAANLEPELGPAVPDGYQGGECDLRIYHTPHIHPLIWVLSPGMVVHCCVCIPSISTDSSCRDCFVRSPWSSSPFSCDSLSIYVWSQARLAEQLSLFVLQSK